MSKILLSGNGLRKKQTFINLLIFPFLSLVPSKGVGCFRSLLYVHSEPPVLFLAEAQGQRTAVDTV